MMTHRRIVSGFLAVLACGLWAVEVSATPHLRADAVDRASQQPMLAEAATQFEPVIDVDRLPHCCMRIGNNSAVSANMSQAVKAGRYGRRLVVPWTGSLEHVQFNITSNRTNEMSKSAVAGNRRTTKPDSRRGRFCSTSTSPMNVDRPMTAASAGSTNSSSMACP